MSRLMWPFRGDWSFQFLRGVVILFTIPSHPHTEFDDRAGVDRSRCRRTPLHLACLEGRADIALDLIARGVDISAKNNDGVTPLHYACETGRTDIALALIARGADIFTKDNYGRTPLHWACLKGSTDIALALIDLGADIFAKDNDGDTPLRRACLKGSTDIALALIDVGADNDGNTPLHCACYHGHIETTLALIARGADIFSKNRFGQTFADVSPDILPRVYERLHVSTVRSYITCTGRRTNQELK